MLGCQKNGWNIIITRIIVAEFSVANPHVAKCAEALQIPRTYWVCQGRLAFAVRDHIGHFFVYN